MSVKGLSPVCPALHFSAPIEFRIRGPALSLQSLVPDVVIMALLAEARANGCALLLDHGPLIGNGLGRPHVADKLLYCIGDVVLASRSRFLAQSMMRHEALTRRHRVVPSKEADERQKWPFLAACGDGAGSRAWAGKTRAVGGRETSLRRISCLKRVLVGGLAVSCRVLTPRNVGAARFCVLVMNRGCNAFRPLGAV